MNAEPNKSNIHKNRLYWRCRRGMAELDFLLQNFLEKNYHTLSAADLTAFQALLDIPDPLLLGYLLKGSVPMDQQIRDVVQKIRAAVGH